MTPPRLLDENALQEREQTIITVAITLIQRLGIENLTMDKVVAQVPFSKGTVYKHFIGKEDLLLAISNHAIKVLSDLFSRAYLFKAVRVNVCCYLTSPTSFMPFYIRSFFKV